jgi:hypothetical protein
MYWVTDITLKKTTIYNTISLIIYISCEQIDFFGSFLKKIKKNSLVTTRPIPFLHLTYEENS